MRRVGSYDRDRDAVPAATEDLRLFRSSIGVQRAPFDVVASTKAQFSGLGRYEAAWAGTHRPRDPRGILRTAIEKSGDAG